MKTLKKESPGEQPRAPKLQKLEPNSKPEAAPKQAPELIDSLGEIKFERRRDGGFIIRLPVEGRIFFAPGEEQKAQKCFGELCTRHKEKALSRLARNEDGVFTAADVRPLVKEEITLRDFLGVCTVRILLVLELVNQLEGSEAEKDRVRQKLLRFQAQQRLEMAK